MSEKTRDEQIALIKTSVRKWNVWRDLRDDRADLRDAYLHGALLRGADLRGADLRGALLRDADLRVADLRDADLRGANLRDTYLSGALLRGADLRDAYLRWAIKIIRLICRIDRSDDYLFLGFSTKSGLMIKAGCRLLSPDDYRAHIAKQYPGTPKATETLRIIKYIEECAAAEIEQ